MEEKKEFFRFKDVEEFKLALAKEPNKGWIKERSLGGSRTASYTPIEVKQALADMMFREWDVVDEKYMNVLNEVVCTVKISALPDYPGSDYIVFTGSASKPVTCKSGSKAENFPVGKTNNALETCIPGVRSEAISNALTTKGNVFGRNVGRSVSNDFSFNLDYKKDEETK